MRQNLPASASKPDFSRKYGFPTLNSRKNPVSLVSIQNCHENFDLLTARILVCHNKLIFMNSITANMTLKELQPQLLALSPEEKTQAIQFLAQSLTNFWSGIQKTPGVCGGDACIGQTRIPVWVLVNARRLGISESELLEDYPTLRAADLANAWAYAEAYPDEIETAIQENEDD